MRWCLNSGGDCPRRLAALIVESHLVRQGMTGSDLISRWGGGTAAPSMRGARLGIPVLVIGNPFGLAHSVSRGYVAGLGRRLELGPRQLGGLIQVDASLHPGDSGALLADLQGGWLGVIRSGLAAPAESDRKGRESSTTTSGFAIPARDALWVADQLRTRRRVDRAYLGVTMDLAAPAARPPASPTARCSAASWPTPPASAPG